MYLPQPAIVLLWESRSGNQVCSAGKRTTHCVSSVTMCSCGHFSCVTEVAKLGTNILSSFSVQEFYLFHPKLWQKNRDTSTLFSPALSINGCRALGRRECHSHRQVHVYSQRLWVGRSWGPRVPSEALVQAAVTGRSAGSCAHITWLHSLSMRPEDSALDCVHLVLQSEFPSATGAQ